MWVSIVVIIVGTEICALALILTRRWRQEHPKRYQKTPIAGDVFGVVGTGFAVILAFVIFTAFESYADRAGGRRDRVRGHPADVLPRAVLPAESRDTLEGGLICYSRAVVNDEWATMAVGRSSTLVDHWVDKLDDDMVALPVTTNKEIEVFNTWFSRAAERQEGRRGRLAESAPYVPPFVWAMLVLLFVVVVGYQILFASPKRPLIPQVLGVSAVAATMLAGIVVVYVLDAPFADRGAQLPPNRMQATLTAMETEYQGNATPIPCDELGNPKG